MHIFRKPSIFLCTLSSIAIMTLSAGYALAEDGDETHADRLQESRDEIEQEIGAKGDRVERKIDHDVHAIEAIADPRAAEASLRGQTEKAERHAKKLERKAEHESDKLERAAHKAEHDASEMAKGKGHGKK